MPGTTRDKDQECPRQVQSTGSAPFENITDFTELPHVCGCWHLLVTVCTFSGWAEASPTRNETAQVVTRILLREIIPHFGIPGTIGSDNGPDFVAKIVQRVARELKITWKLHTAYQPQSSRKVERMNLTQKSNSANCIRRPTSLGSNTANSPFNKIQPH